MTKRNNPANSVEVEAIVDMEGISLPANSVEVEATVDMEGISLPALSGIDMTGDDGKGLEGTDLNSFAIPFLTIIHRQSPQVDEDDPEYIPGAIPGMFRNSVTNEVFSGKAIKNKENDHVGGGVIFLPCAFQRRFLKWGPRSTGSAFKGEFLPETVIEMQASGEVVGCEGTLDLFFPTKDGEIHAEKCDKLVDVRNHFGLLIHPETNEWMDVLLCLKRTQIKRSKQLASLVSSVKVPGLHGKITPPTWVNRVRLNTIPESNAKGSWHGITVALDPDGIITDQSMYDAGKKLNALITGGAGKVNLNYENSDSDMCEKSS